MKRIDNSSRSSRDTFIAVFDVCRGYGSGKKATAWKETMKDEETKNSRKSVESQANFRFCKFEIQIAHFGGL